MFFLHLSGVYINLTYILDIDRRFREVQMTNGDKYDLTEEELDRIVRLLGVK